LRTRLTILRTLLALVAACGRIDYTPIDSGSIGVDAGGPDAGADAGGDAAPAPDAGLVAPRYGEPVLIGALNSNAADLDPSLTDDELEIYFISERSGNAEIWWSTRASVDAPWARPAVRAELADADAETDPELSPDGLHIYFASQRMGTAMDVDLWESSRATRAGAWSAPVRVASLESNNDECCAQTDPTRLHLVFARVTMRGGPDLHTARWNDAIGWTDIAPIVELSSTEADSNPFLVREWIFFDSARPGVGERDVYLSRRASPLEPFEPPVLVDSLVTPADERDVWVSSDLERVYFSRVVGTDAQLFLATRIDP
jgi:hypothetical protein